MKHRILKGVTITLLALTFLLSDINDVLAGSSNRLGGDNGGASQVAYSPISSEQDSISSSVKHHYPSHNASPAYTGYRFYCIDNQENLVSKVVDIDLTSANDANLAHVGNMYTAIFNQSYTNGRNIINISRDELNAYYQTSCNEYDAMPAGILRQNNTYGCAVDTNADGVADSIDIVKYKSTATQVNGGSEGALNGIKAWIMSSLGNNSGAVTTQLMTSVLNGNTGGSGNRASGASSNNNPYTSGGAGLNSNSTANKAWVDAYNALQNNPSDRNAQAVINAILNSGSTMNGIFGNSSMYSALTSATGILSDNPGSSRANNYVNMTYGSQSAYKPVKAIAYDDLMHKGYDPTTAMIAVMNANGSTSGKISSLTMASLDETDELSQIIPASGVNTVEISTDNRYFAEFVDYIRDKCGSFFTDRVIVPPAYRNDTISIMAHNNLILCVEPVMWFKWTNGGWDEKAVGFRRMQAQRTSSREWCETHGTWKGSSCTGSCNTYHPDEDYYYFTYLDESGNICRVNAAGDDTDPDNCYPSGFGEGDGYRRSSAYGYSYNIPSEYTNYVAYTTEGATYECDRSWTYGSLRNCIQYINSVHGGIANSTITELCTVYLPIAMETSSDITFDSAGGAKIFKAGTSGVSQQFSGNSFGALSSCASTTGYGIHMYSTDGAFSKTRDDDRYKMVSERYPKHKAPKPAYSGEYSQFMGDNNIRIVKTYRVWSGASIGEGEVIEESTYIEDEEPYSIYILNESGWQLSDWYISNLAQNSLYNEGVENARAKWDSMKSEVYGNHSMDPAQYASINSGGTGRDSNGFPTNDTWTNNSDIPQGFDGGCRVSVTCDIVNGVKQDTLYVLFEAAGTIDILSEDANLTESELDDITTTDNKPIAWSGLPSLYEEMQEGVNISGDGSTYKIVRGTDKVTLKSFRGNLGSILNTALEEQTAGTINNWFYGQEGNTAENSDYAEMYTLMLPGDLTVDSSMSVDVYHGQNIPEVNPNKYNAIGDAKYRVDTGVRLSVRPYYWMTISDLTGEKSLRYMAGERTRTLSTYDYAEITQKSRGTLNIDSDMWATDKKITSVVGNNSALKGGAMAELSTNTKAQVYATTYSMVWDNDQEFDASGSDTVDGITSADAMSRHNEFVDTAALQLRDNWEIEMYVEKGIADLPAGRTSSSSSGVKNPTGIHVYSGASIDRLDNGSSITSTAKKYYLTGVNGKIDDYGNVATTSLMETEVGNTETKYIRVFSLPNGNIYYTTGNTYDECDVNMVSIMESAKNNGGIYDSNRLAVKGSYSSSAGTNACLAAVKNIDQDVYNSVTKTKAIDVLADSLELNTGDDMTAPWTGGDDRTWYNEGSWVTVMMNRTTINVGMVTTSDRTVIIDPKLIPKSTSKNTQNTAFNSSAFRVTFIGDDTMGQFRGETLQFQGTDSNLKFKFENLFDVTETFYIPNSVVTDNK